MHLFYLMLIEMVKIYFFGGWLDVLFACIDRKLQVNNKYKCASSNKNHFNLKNYKLFIEQYKRTYIYKVHVQRINHENDHNTVGSVIS